MIERYFEWLEKYRINPPNENQIEKLDFFATLLHKWNKKINLTAARYIDEIYARHILDSLTPLKLGINKEKTVVDLGSGGGLPGIPLSIMCPFTQFFLIEKVGKKCAFLNSVKRELNLSNVEIVNSVFETFNIVEKHSLITRAVKIDKKIAKKIKEAGTENIYTFETKKPDCGEIFPYKLPKENKERFIKKLRAVQ